MRSLMFVPADSERKLVKALAGPADVVILDLEDSVAAYRKEAARRLAGECLTKRRQQNRYDQGDDRDDDEQLDQREPAGSPLARANK